MPDPAPDLRVLVIDDDPILRELFSALLAPEGYTVDTAESGEAALALLAEGGVFDVLLCDMQLPGLRGAALRRLLREAAPEARLVGMSGSEPAPEDLAGVDAFLLKPFGMEDLAQAVQAASPTTSLASSEHLTAPELSGAATVLDQDTYAGLARSIPAAPLAELYQLTLTDVAERLARMGEALAAGDGTSFRSEAHALKGGCSMVGATELAALAARAEAGSSGDTPTPAEFTAAAERLRSIIAARSTMHL